ncbi:MAG: hypothetical protein AB1403_21365, partial [Candidatus Riflebacteria bacterium]
GKVIGFEPEKRVVIVENSLENGKVYRISLNSEFSSVPETGSNFSAQVRPIKSGQEVIAEIITAF